MKAPDSAAENQLDQKNYGAAGTGYYGEAQPEPGHDNSGNQSGKA